MWPSGSVHHGDPLSCLGNGAVGMSFSDRRCQMCLGRKDPWEPTEDTDVCLNNVESIRLGRKNTEVINR